MSRDTWNPEQYERFKKERSQPFFDLLGLVEPAPGMRIVDLGCGTGELTRILHERLDAAKTLGIDRSPAMLEKTIAHATSGLSFEQGDIGAFGSAHEVDLVFSNAALHWLDGHPSLFARLEQVIADGGQLAVQVPANDDHPSHIVADELVAEEPFRQATGGYQRGARVLSADAYALLLDRLGFPRQHVRLQVYVHHLPSCDDVVEWVRGTLLTDYERRMQPPLFEDFLDRYRRRLLPQLDDHKPYVYPFKRLLIWGRKGDDQRSVISNP
jgi:trans-aconitate 2-methyltransferase